MTGLGLMVLSVGIVLMGYFIGKGLENLGHPRVDNKVNRLITEYDLAFHLNLSEDELKELLTKYPTAPKVELKGTTYYPYKLFLEWLSTIETYEQ